MNKSIYVKYDTLERVIRGTADKEERDLAFFIEESLFKTKDPRFHDPIAHLKNFYNNYIVERAFVLNYMDDGLHFNHVDEHLALYEGFGYYEADCHLGDKQVEIKSFTNLDKMYRTVARWIINKPTEKYPIPRKEIYDAKMVLIYCKSNRKSYVYYVDETKDVDELLEASKPIDVHNDLIY